MICLRLEEWMPVYREICRDFSFDPDRDREGAILLASILGEKGNRSLETARTRVPDEVVICGTAECLSRELRLLPEGSFLVAADGATSDVLSAGLRPEMIVTDLDGDVEDQLAANSRGTTVFVHAHGDNMVQVGRFAGLFVEPVVGTCQVPPPPGLVNYGGFTDGDRAACICAELGAKRIRLVGFDLERPAPKSGKDLDVKRRKLWWAGRILDILSSKGVSVDHVLGVAR